MRTVQFQSLAALAAHVPPDPIAAAVYDFTGQGGQGGKGVYLWDISSTEDADGVGVIAPDPGQPGRWLKIADVQSGIIQGSVNVDSIAALKLTEVEVQNVYVLGYYTPGDGGGGPFYWDPTSTAPDDGGLVIQSSLTPTGRWLRVL